MLPSGVEGGSGLRNNSERHAGAFWDGQIEASTGNGFCPPESQIGSECSNLEVPLEGEKEQVSATQSDFHQAFLFSPSSLRPSHSSFHCSDPHPKMLKTDISGCVTSGGVMQTWWKAGKIFRTCMCCRRNGGGWFESKHFREKWQKSKCVKNPLLQTRRRTTATNRKFQYLWKLLADKTCLCLIYIYFFFLFCCLFSFTWKVLILFWSLCWQNLILVCCGRQHCDYVSVRSRCARYLAGTIAESNETLEFSGC